MTAAPTGSDSESTFVCRAVSSSKVLATMNCTIGFKDVCGRGFAHDDVLQAHQTVEQGFRSRRAAGNVDVHRNAAIDALHRGVGIKWPTGGGTSAHGNRPFRFRHLLVNSAHHRPHL